METLTSLAETPRKQGFAGWQPVVDGVFRVTGALLAPIENLQDNAMEKDEVRKVASLARLELSDEELETYGQHLTQILGYVEVLDEVDIKDVTPMPHAVDLQNVFRGDERSPSLDRKAALSNAAKSDGQFFQVPQILEQKDA